MQARTLLAALALSMLPLQAAAQDASLQGDGIDRLVAALQRAISDGDENAVRSLARYNVNPAAMNEFVGMMLVPRATVAAVKERDRALLTNGEQRVRLEILTDRDGEGRVSTWRMDLQPPSPPATAGGPWTITDIEKLTVVSGLYRLALNGSAEYDVHGLELQAPDLTITLSSGRAFVAESRDGPTAIVLMGNGRAVFSPRPQPEKRQVEIYCGSETLNTEFRSVFIRINPGEFYARIAPEALVLRPVDAGDLRKAQQLFEANVPQSFQIDLGDLSAERWSLVPNPNDLVAEIATKKFGTLTYARSSNEPEDISFFERRRRRNIAVYASETKLAARGRFFDEDDQADYDVTRYDVRVSFSPDRLWLDGTVRLSIRTKAPVFSTMTLHLADPLVVRSVSSPGFGRLLHLRVVGQNSILVGFPATIAPGTDLDVVVTYGGRLPPQALEREAAAVQQDQREQQDVIVIPPEPQFVYSSRTYWYPQATVTDYATAVLRIAVPEEYDVVASGAPRGTTSLPADATSGRPRREFLFETTRPARYLACVISRFEALQAMALSLPTTDTTGGSLAPRDAIADGGARNATPTLSLVVQANPREFGRARSFADRAADILKFYTSLLADAPYGAFTVALTESDLPGGHSPAYFAILNQPLPTTPFTWTNDPVSFPSYPSFFLAHEIAHQWWGQAVGWKNYHEQWLSEGFAQYFAALYGDRERGADQFTSLLRQMRKTAIDMSPQGPVYLGYRLGHIKGDSRVFRALVYNKGAMVLHMLRRLVGDEAFFRGLREFYGKWRYAKAGTDDFRAVMEQVSGRPLERFFERWIYEAGIPTIKFTSRTEGDGLHVRFEQKGDVFDVPITVTLTYADDSTQDVLVVVDDRSVERTIPLKQALKRVDVNRDSAALARIDD